MKHPILINDARREMTLKEFVAWADTEDGLRARAIETGYENAKKIGLLDALHEAREGNAARLWGTILQMARDICQTDGTLWEKKAQEMAESEILDLGYFPPNWTLQDRELYAAEQHAQNLEDLERWNAR